MTTIFEASLTNLRRLNTLTKQCEAIAVFSDTAIFKVRKTGIYVGLTDCENLCGVECRIPDKALQCIQFTDPKCDRWCTKILLEHFTSELRRALRSKQPIVFTADESNPLILKIRMPDHTTPIKSTLHRPRVFRKTSTNKFIKDSQHVAQFRILNAELMKIINVQCVASGNHGGVGQLRIVPDGERCLIEFMLHGNCAAKVRFGIHTHRGSAFAPMVQIPTQTIHIHYFLMFLKRSQGLFHTAHEFTHFYVSEQGMMLKIESSDALSTVIFTPDIQNVDLNSFV